MLTILLDQTSSIPMYEQIYNHIKKEIKTGNIAPYSKLPSSRSLAENLSVSRNTIDLAYSQLISEGYIEAKTKSGYYVCLVSDLTHISITSSKVSTHVTDVKQYSYDFTPFSIDIKSFPYNTWKRLSKDAMNDYNHQLFLQGMNQGDENLRQAIRHYLQGFRGVTCNIDQIIVGAGVDYLLQLLCQIFTYLPNNISIAMENPTYIRAYRIMKGFSFPILPISMDKSGMNVDELTSFDATIAYVTPTHQYPLGVVMPINRRLELLQWAYEKKERYIIEDDHDSEFRYKGKPIPALQGLDSMGKVIYIGTFSRALTPSIRVGYMVLPENILGLYKEHLYYYSSTVSRVDQYILSQFIDGGYFERHLNKMRKIYKSKHDILIQELKIFEDKILIKGENAGLHIVIQFKTKLSEDDIILLAEANDIKLYGLTKHYIPTSNPISNDQYPTILLGYSNLTEDKIKEGISLLYRCLIESL